MTCREMAARLKCARGYYSELENGRRYPGPRLTREMLRVLQVPREELFYSEPPDPIVDRIIELTSSLSEAGRAEVLAAVARIVESEAVRKAPAGPRPRVVRPKS